jgi:WD40 repeat protein
LLQIHALEMQDDDSKSLSKKIYNHPQGEIWQLCCNKVENNVICARFSYFSSDGSLKQGANVYNLSKSEEDAPLGANLSVEYSFEEKDLSYVSWMPGEVTKLMALAENRLSLYDMNTGPEPVSTGKLQGKGFNELTCGAWNPHQNSQQYATVNEYHIRGWDVRTMSQVWAFESPGNQVVRSIDFNPNKQYYLVSSGDDGAIRFWDIRNTKKALALRNDHSHWVWSVRYNQYHDQLVLSSSSDGNVVLSSMASISSEPDGHMIDYDDDEHKDNDPTLEDGRIRTFDDHEDSVYCVEWASADPWIFASLSFDGRLVINHVPRSIKFRILNLV